ncbi:hypothetical protein BBJ28_00007479 [Nothophytophthora sp. Chile5]|nr:hypothetical protein BBJ28_00007479 [Nothophytophthora sp. Chile5]
MHETLIVFATTLALDVMLSPLKRRRGREQLYLVPAKRSKYAKAFEWNDTDGKTMHHFPKDMELPVCNLAAMWALWLCGDPRSKHPPYRILTPPDLLAGRARRSLSTLRFVMLEIESRVLAKGEWVSSPSPEDAAGMLAKVKTSLAVRPNKNRGSLQPVELLQWTSMGRIIRDQKKLEADEEDEE